MARRIFHFVILLLASWTVMTFTHEAGHLVGGWFCGGTLLTADLLPWHMPYSIFSPDPKPLVTLWSGPILGVLVPLLVALVIQREWSRRSSGPCPEVWFIAHFCLLANGTYLALAWWSGDPELDTPKLLKHGASPVSIGIYCLATIILGYAGFRRSCLLVFRPLMPTGAERSIHQTVRETGSSTKDE